MTMSVGRREALAILHMMRVMANIGVGQRRLEGRAKVTGATRFTADLRLAGLTHARLLLSPHAAARIRRVDLEAVRQAPGVLDAVSGADLPPASAPGPDLPLEKSRPRGWPLDRDPFLYETNVPGIFSVGDVRAGSGKRVASAVGEGSGVVSMVHRYLEKL